MEAEVHEQKNTHHHRTHINDLCNRNCLGKRNHICKRLHIQPVRRWAAAPRHLAATVTG
jgi:hypothetical protein